MEWALNGKEYYMAYILYTEYGVGIPNKFLYGLETKKLFSSVNDFLTNSDVRTSYDKYLNKIFVTFKHSQYTKLSEWDNSWGYRFLSKS